jgi:hypothetical protein
MKKKSDTEICSVEVDTITGHYYVAIPEWMMNELSWYEDTSISIKIEGNEIILREHEIN